MENKEGTVETEKLRSEYGKAVASTAIKEMHTKADNDDYENVNMDEEVISFIKKCHESNENVIDVVMHIAKREKIDITGEQPKDMDKARLWMFLGAVIKTFVCLFINNTMTVQEILDLLRGRNCRDVKEDASAEGEGPKRMRRRCYVMRRVFPSMFGYAFNW